MYFNNSTSAAGAKIYSVVPFVLFGFNGAIWNIVMKTLILTVGLPRSGKSTWAKKQNVPIVNPDSIRYALHGERFLSDAEPMVWVIAKYMVKSLFLAGHDVVILDATNTTKARRDEWKSKSWVREFMVVGTTKEVCIERANSENDAYIIPIIEKMAAQFESIADEEECDTHAIG